MHAVLSLVTALASIPDFTGDESDLLSLLPFDVAGASPLPARASTSSTAVADSLNTRAPTPLPVQSPSASPTSALTPPIPASATGRHRLRRSQVVLSAQFVFGLLDLFPAWARERAERRKQLHDRQLRAARGAAAGTPPPVYVQPHDIEFCD